MGRISFLGSAKVLDEAGIDEAKEEPLCLQMLQVRRRSPLIFYTVVFLLLAHWAAIALLPLFVPDGTYLSLYLGNTARESTGKFLNGNHPFLIYDPLLGWRNRPDVRHDKWRIDEQGARTTHPVGAASSGKRLVLFLGNSLINGSTNVSNEETISACIEDAATESINFGTMLYALDQVYLDYKERLGGYQADVVVVGLSVDPTAGLLNQYLPFRVKSESKMPFFKPRFEIASGTLSILPVPSLRAYESLFDRPDVLETLAKSDAYYSEFSRYKRFGLMPGTNLLYALYKRVRSNTRFMGGSGGETGGMPLLKKLLDQIGLEARRRHAAVIFMALPDLKSVAPGIWERLRPDLYAERVNDLKAEGYPLLDLRPFLRKSGLPPEKLFDSDGSHYTPAGNRIIAAALKEVIEHAS